MITVNFYNQAEIADELLKFSVIATKYIGKWIFCRHKQRTTWEIPGVHREHGEDILDTAKRELYEETGATEFDIKPVCVYGVTRDDETTYGLLCFAEVTILDELPSEMEIGEIQLFDTLPENLTYPAIQPHLFQKVTESKSIAYCGLACLVCSEKDKCVGCQSGGCDIHGWCKNYNCCRGKGLNGCWECSDFPCNGTMLDKPRIRAFARFVKEYGTDELTRCLLHNKENGIVYHYDGQLVGDYDKCKTEDEIIEMIKTGVKP